MRSNRHAEIRIESLVERKESYLCALFDAAQREPIDIFAAVEDAWHGRSRDEKIYKFLSTVIMPTDEWCAAIVTKS